ncbi:radical SAM protein [Pirellulaceae bacterium]|nr:radical SAM protein [Pirellulaceae bacterium]
MSSIKKAPSRRIALVCMTPVPDTDELGGMRLPSYGVYRILASLLADERCSHSEVSLIDVGEPNVEEYVQAIVALEPDLIGMSAFLWSTPCLVAVAREVKRYLPDCIIVFGGPSARAAMFDLAPYSPASDYLDALVTTEGERTFNEIASLTELTIDELANVPGLTIPQGSAWHLTGPITKPDCLDLIASPYQMGLMENRSIAYLETFRGCPLSCSFCEWGISDVASTVFSKEYILKEFEAFSNLDVHAVFLVDAGLNLNKQSFNNLFEAQKESGFLKNTQFWAEIYPSHVNDKHLEFLENAGTSYLGIGLQSLDKEVLTALNRPFNSERFDGVVRTLASVAKCELQIIFGLPGETPEGFLRTLEHSLSLPVSVRVYHCLVLPDALMTRGKPEWNIIFDTDTLAMTSCTGWTEKDLLDMRQLLTNKVEEFHGLAGDFWWSFPRQVS